MRLPITHSILGFMLVWTMAVLPAAAVAQTARTAPTGQLAQIVAPKNKYKTSEDVRLGREAAAEAERMYPAVNDETVQRYVQSIGERLVTAIPGEFQHPEFHYRFTVVDVSDLNAFALPGGPMFVNRGMIQASRNEGELAGVMAHEISHVALRHATAQATKQNSFGNQAAKLGMILGGAAVLGQTGAELGNMGAQAWTTKYSREYESQADALGAQIIAAAGYDPHDLANVFQTLAQQGGAHGPQWLSSHPDPGNRYAKINEEAKHLTVSQNPTKLTREFERAKSRLAGMPRAYSMQELEQIYQQTGGRGYGGQNGGGQTGPYGGRQTGGYPGQTGGYPGQTGGQTSSTAGGRYTQTVQFPSQRTRGYSNEGLSMDVPINWQEFPSSDQVAFAPDGAYGDQGITRGVMLGVIKANSSDGIQATQSYVDSLLQTNGYLQQRGSVSRTTISGRTGNVVQLSGRSDVTGEAELVTVYTTLLPNNVMVYIATVVPQRESSQYQNAFRSMLNSVRLNG